ncbi:MAG: flavin reductase family protein [Eubacterium ventriosum]
MIQGNNGGNYVKRNLETGKYVISLPSVLVTVADDEGNDNVLTVAWTGTVCSDPAMVYVSVRPSKILTSYDKRNREFVINLTTEELAYAID